MLGKYVFLVCLWANLLIGIGTALFAFFTSGMAIDEFGIILMVGLYGLGITLPSLIVLFIFHVAYTYKNRPQKNYLLHYSLLVIFINLAYWLVSAYMSRFITDEIVPVFFLYTTFAGVLALLLVNHRIKKRISNTANAQVTEFTY
jgi:hypothetical protein